MISDFVGYNFPDFKNDEKMFDKDEPFKPFQVLLMILPPTSKKLIPECYHSIFEDLKEFYPTKFSLDFNGKRNPWEALVILPFVKSDIVVEAEQKIYNSVKDDKLKLSENELERNIRGSNWLYNYDKNGDYTSFVKTFKNFKCANTKIKRTEFSLYIGVKTNLDKNYEMKTVAYNFPSLKYINYEFFLYEGKQRFQKIEFFKVIPIDQNSHLNTNLMAKLIESILKKEDTVFFDCPFRREGYLQAIISPNGYFYLKGKKVEIDSHYRTDNVKRDGMKGFYFNTTKYLCEVFPIKSIARNLDGSLLKIYEVTPMYVPFEVTSFNSLRPEEFKKLKDDFKIHSTYTN